MAQEDTTKYNPRISIRGKSIRKRVAAGDQASGTEHLDWRAAAGDQIGVRLAAGDQA